jgi:hypothetical protein
MTAAIATILRCDFFIANDFSVRMLNLPFCFRLMPHAAELRREHPHDLPIVCVGFTIFTLVPQTYGAGFHRAFPVSMSLWE